MAKKKAATSPQRGRRKKNKSKAIRAYLEEHQDAGPTEVVAALRKRRMRVTTALVSNVKARMAGKKPPVRKRRRARQSANDVLSFSSLMQAKKLAERFGGVENARRALNVLAKLQ